MKLYICCYILLGREKEEKTKEKEKRQRERERKSIITYTLIYYINYT